MALYYVCQAELVSASRLCMEIPKQVRNDKKTFRDIIWKIELVSASLNFWLIF